VDYRNYSCRIMVARLFWRENQPKFPKNWQLDTHAACHRRHTHHPKLAWGDINQSRLDD